MQSLGNIVTANALNAWGQNTASICAILPVTIVPKGAVQMLVLGMLSGTPPAGTTSFTLQLLRGATTGGLQIAFTTVTGPITTGLGVWTIFGIDILIETGAIQYCLVATTTGASGASTFGTCAIAAIFLQ
jgi:hypothetical protein